MAISGRDEIEAFHRGASDGVFTMDESTARRCAEVVDRLISGLDAQIGNAQFMRIEAGDTFDSAQQMLAGFSAKADEFESRLGDFIAAAQRLKSSFEIAGALVAEVEADNASGVLRAGGGG